MKSCWAAILLVAMGATAATADAEQLRHRPRRARHPVTTKPVKTKPVKTKPVKTKQGKAPRASGLEIDRVVIRWHSSATGGEKKPQFITARELAFEARLEALAEGTREGLAYADKHVRAALQRHIAETMLSRLPVSPKPTPKQVARYAEQARKLLLEKIAEGTGADEGAENDDARLALANARIEAAGTSEGISREELDALLRRRARASWYLDRMVTPMLQPSELDLREAHRAGETPFTDQPFEQVHDALERWYVSTHLATALDRYFRNTRDRVKVYLIDRHGRRGRPL